jgi:hypothetical protein
MTARDSKGSERNLTVLVRYEMKRDGAGYRKGDVVLLVENDKGQQYQITLRRNHQHSCTCPSRRRCYHLNACIALENTRAAARVALVRAEMALAPQIQTSERITHDTARKSTSNERGGIRRDYRSAGRAA